MNLTERRNAKGKITSFRVRVFSHRDAITGAQKFKNLSVKYDETKSEAWNRKNAESKAYNFETAVEELTVATSNITFHDYSEYVIDAKQRAGILGSSTAYAERGRRKRFAPFIGHIQLKHMTPTALNMAYAEALKAGKTEKTVRAMHCFIRGILTVAVKEGLIPRNYASAAMPPKCEAPNFKRLNNDELKDFITALYSSQEYYEYKVFFTLMLATALRIGEICALKWDYIDLNEGKIGVFQHFITDDNGTHIEPGGKTNASTGWLHLDADIIQMLSEYKAYYFNKAQQYGSKWDYSTGAVFSSPKKKKMGDYIMPQTVRDWLDEFLTAHDLPRITPHIFRHTSILQLDEGINIADVSKRARHSRPDVTMKFYVHTMRTNDRHCCEAVTKILPKLPQAMKS